MHKCEFYILEHDSITTMTSLVANIIAQTHRKYFGTLGKSLVLCDPKLEMAEALSKEIWKINGFIPNALVDSPTADLAPIVIAEQFVPNFRILVNLKLDRPAFTQEELSSDLLIDFALKTAPDLLIPSRNRYKQIRTLGVTIESKNC